MSAVNNAAATTRTTRHPRAWLRRRGHGAPRGLGHDDGRPRRVARAGGGGGREPDARERPLLLPLHLLPRAERRAVRARDPRPGFATDEPADKLGERLSLPPPSSTCASAWSRPDAAAEPARDERNPSSLGTAPGRRQASRGLLVLFHGAAPTRTTFSRCSTCSIPSGSSSASRHAGRPPARGGTRVGARGSRDARPGLPADLRGGLELARPARSRGGNPAREDGARRLLAGRRDDVRARPRQGPPAAGSADLAQRLIPSVPGFELDLEPPLAPLAIGHGTYDPVIGVEWGRRARAQFEETVPPPLPEYPLPHAIEPGFVVELRDWLPQALAAAPGEGERGGGGEEGVRIRGGGGVGRWGGQWGGREIWDGGGVGEGWVRGWVEGWWAGGVGGGGGVRGWVEGGGRGRGGGRGSWGGGGGGPAPNRLWRRAKS